MALWVSRVATLTSLGRYLPNAAARSTGRHRPTAVRYLTRIRIDGSLVFVLKTSPLGAQLNRLPIRLLEHDSLRVGIVTLRNRTLSPVAQLFIETAREVVAALAIT